MTGNYYKCILIKKRDHYICYIQSGKYTVLVCSRFTDCCWAMHHFAAKLYICHVYASSAPDSV